MYHCSPRDLAAAPDAPEEGPDYLSLGAIGAHSSVTRAFYRLKLWGVEILLLVVMWGQVSRSGTEPLKEDEQGKFN